MLTKVPKVLQRPSSGAEPFWKTKVQRGNTEPSLQDVLNRLELIELKIDALLEAEGIEVQNNPENTPEEDGGWTNNR